MYFCGPHAMKTEKQSKQIKKRQRNGGDTGTVEGEGAEDEDGRG